MITFWKLLIVWVENTDIRFFLKLWHWTFLVNWFKSWKAMCIQLIRTCKVRFVGTENSALFIQFLFNVCFGLFLSIKQTCHRQVSRLTQPSYWIQLNPTSVYALHLKESKPLIFMIRNFQACTLNINKSICNLNCRTEVVLHLLTNSNTLWRPLENMIRKTKQKKKNWPKL